MVLPVAEYIGAQFVGTGTGGFMADGNLLKEVESGALLRASLWIGVGVALYLTFTNSIGALLNPLLANLRLSATPT
jgi:hypothetical protein